MNKTVIPGTAVSVSRLGFGTASLHHLFSGCARRALLGAAAEEGIRHFDTSPYYGYGLAETELGRFVCRDRAAFTLTTKIGLYPWRFANKQALGVWTRKAIGKFLPWVALPVVNWQVAQARASLDDSLRRLRTDYVDFLLLHEPDASLIEKDEMFAWLDREFAAGRVRSWGVAGVRERVAPFVQDKNPLARVVQTQDSLENREAEFLFAKGRELQFTYGYLSSESREQAGWSRLEVLCRALERNRTGSVLVSTRRVDRVQQLGKALL